jgi:hypothetical protein
MNVNREELKRLIDKIPEQDALEVYDFIGYLNMKRERSDSEQLDVAMLAKDSDLIRQVERSQEDRKHGRIYAKETGIDYLRSKITEFEHEQNI